MMALRGLTLFFHVSWLGSCCLHPSPFHKIIWRQWPLLTLLGCWNSCEHRHATLISIYQHYHPPPTFTLPLLPCWCSLISGESLFNDFENYFFTHWSLVDVSVALPGSLLSSVLRPLNTLSQCLYLWSWAESTDTGRWRHSVEQQVGTHSHQSSISSSSHTTFRLLQIISKSDTNKIFTSSSVAAVNVR